MGFKMGWRSHWTLSLKHSMTSFCFVMFLWPHLWHMEVPGLGIDSELYPSHGNTRSKAHLHTLLHRAVMLSPLPSGDGLSFRGPAHIL